MIEEYQIELIQMMENAGRNLAVLTREYFFGNQSLRKRVLILVGTGGNGGGALVCARHLANYGVDIHIQLSKSPASLKPIPHHQLTIIQQMNIPFTCTKLPPTTIQYDLIIDGLIGYNLTGPPRDSTADLIVFANQSNTPILSLDVPSGLDATSGTAYNPTIKASATMTLALTKTGLFSQEGIRCSGRLFLADISVPASLYAKLSPPVIVPQNIFSSGELVEI